MPLAVAELPNGPACRTGAYPVCTEPVVHQLSLEHSRLQRQRRLPELHGEKAQPLTRQTEIGKCLCGPPAEVTFPMVHTYPGGHSAISVYDKEFIQISVSVQA
jgi:hypothetical protein